MTARMTSTAHALGRTRWAAVAAVGALTLGACAGGDDASDDSDTSGDPSAPSSAASSPTASDETTDEVELTEPGAQLKFGQSATVDYELRDQGTILELTVDDARRGRLKDFAGFNLAEAYTKNANYYYVRVAAKNVGEGRIGDVEVPLWGISGDNTLLPPVQFTSSFKKCPTEPLPKRFGPGKRHKTCLVFLSPNGGTLEGVSYRPVESFDPIEWRGKVKTGDTKAKKKKKKANGGGNGGNDNGGGDN